MQRDTEVKGEEVTHKCRRAGDASLSIQFENDPHLNIGYIIPRLRVESEVGRYVIGSTQENPRSGHDVVIGLGPVVIVRLMPEAQTQRNTSVGIQVRNAPARMPGGPCSDHEGVGLVVRIVTSVGPGTSKLTPQ